jgi:hypothetical protein
VNYGIERPWGWRNTHIALGIFTAVGDDAGAGIGLRMPMGAGVQRDHQNAPPPRDVDLRASPPMRRR